MSMNVDDLLKFNKKNLQIYLRDNNIPCRKKSGYYIFDETINNLPSRIIISFLKREIVQLIVNIDTQGISFEEKYNLIQKYKDEFYQKFGTPEFDNTNHIDINNISITFTSEKESVYIEGLSNQGEIQNNLIISINKVIVIPNKRIKDFCMWPIYFIGGVFFGLTMYASMGNYNWQSFLICLIGGLAWGLLFGIGMTIFTPSFNKSFQFNKKIMKKIENNVEIKNEEPSFNGTLIVLSDNKKINKMLYLTSKAVIRNDEIHFYYYYLRKFIIIKISLEEINKNVWLNRIEFEIKGSKYFFQLLDPNEINVLKDYIALHLYNKDEYEELFNLFKSEIIKYNPYSVFNSHDHNFLDEEISMITRMIIAKKIRTQDDLHELLSCVYDEEYYYISTLTPIYYNVIKNKYDDN